MAVHPAIKIEWDTDVPMTSKLRFGVDMTEARDFQSDEKKMRHEFIVDNIQREVVYRFKVGWRHRRWSGNHDRRIPFRFAP